MGNKMGKRRGVDERYTRPQGLYDHSFTDERKLKRLIQDAKLAPCYPGTDDTQPELEECPICYLVSTALFDPLDKDTLQDAFKSIYIFACMSTHM